MTALETFEEAMAILGNEYLSPFVKEKLETGEVNVNHDHTVYRKIFYGYSEILNARDALKLSQNLISVAPPRSVKVYKDDYLIYNINSFLNDIYILKERLNTYATWIKRLYRNNHSNKNIEEVINPLFGFVKEVLGKITNIRSIHVHDQRYWDDDLLMLSSIALISGHGSNPAYKNIFDEYYEKEQNRWVKIMESHNSLIYELLETYFERIGWIIINEGQIKMPNKSN